MATITINTDKLWDSKLTKIIRDSRSDDISERPVLIETLLLFLLFLFGRGEGVGGGDESNRRKFMYYNAWTINLPLGHEAKKKNKVVIV